MALNISSDLVPQVINDYNAYTEDDLLIGLADEITLPKIKNKTTSVSGMGIAGEVDSPVPGQFESMEATLNWNTMYSYATKMMNPNKNIQITLRAAMQNDNKNGGYTYTNKQKKININVKVGTDERQLKLTGKVSSEADAKARLIAAIKNANHGATQISFTMLGYPAGASAQCFNLVGYGKMDGKYFVDQMEHSISPSSGYKTQVKASKVEKEDFA